MTANSSPVSWKVGGTVPPVQKVGGTGTLRLWSWYPGTGGPYVGYWVQSISDTDDLDVDDCDHHRQVAQSWCCCIMYSESDDVVIAMGQRLDLVNVSRYCADVYECTASNNIPPAVKRHIKLTVECMYTLLYMYTSIFLYIFALGSSTDKVATALPHQPRNITHSHWLRVTDY